MAVIDSYPESNRNTGWSITSHQYRFSQSFTADGSVLDSAQFSLRRYASPTGTFTAQIYAHSGTYGTDSVPTGSALATSDTVDISTIASGSYNLATFSFSGANRITLSNGVNYCLVLNASGATLDSTNRMAIGRDDTSPTHSGSQAFSGNGGSSYGVFSDDDLIFYVYGGDPITVTPSALGIAFAIGAVTVATSQILTPTPPTIEFQPRTPSVIVQGIGVKPIGLLLTITKRDVGTIVETEELTIGFSPQSPTVVTDQNLALSPLGIEFNPQTATVIIPSYTVSDALQVNFEPQSPAVVTDQIISPGTLGIEFEPQTAGVAFGQTVVLSSVGIEFQPQTPEVAFPALIYPDNLQIEFEPQSPTITGDSSTTLSALGIGFTPGDTTVSISVLNTVSELGIEFNPLTPTFLTENYLALENLELVFAIQTPKRIGGLWNNEPKNTTSWINQTKNLTTWNNENKNSTSWTNADKSEPN